MSSPSLRVSKLLLLPFGCVFFSQSSALLNWTADQLDGEWRQQMAAADCHRRRRIRWLNAATNHSRFQNKKKHFRWKTPQSPSPPFPPPPPHTGQIDSITSTRVVLAQKRPFFVRPTTDKVGSSEMEKKRFLVPHKENNFIDRDAGFAGIEPPQKK